MAITWGIKRYYSLKYFLRHKFGQKVYKVSVDAGFSCPNRDGTVGTEGCIFCSPHGSGDFAGCRSKSITQQLLDSTKGIRDLSDKHGITQYIAYFQAFTNTYANINQLREKYYEAISVPGVVGIAIATRPDCLGKDVMNLLHELSKQTYLWIELGLQTIHENTAQFIRRGYPLLCFEESLNNLRKLEIDTVCHLILGLPNESNEDILSSVKYISKKDIQGIKLHLLHVLEDTYLAKLYQKNEFALLSKEEYIKLVVDCLEILPPNLVIHRLTGDGPKNILLGPEWSKNKIDVLNSIEKELVARDSWQSKYFE